MSDKNPRREPDPVGLARARAKSRYEIGDWAWADMIIEAYLNEPEEDPPEADQVSGYPGQFLKESRG